MFWQSTAMHLRRRGTAGGAMAFVIYVFLVMVSIAMAQAQDSAPAESSSAHPETPLPSSIQQGSVDQKVTNPCSLLAPDNNSQSPATGKEADMTIGTFAYAPLSAHCKFHLFLKSTYSPYTFASAGFQATWAHAMGQWPHYGGGVQGWATFISRACYAATRVVVTRNDNGDSAFNTSEFLGALFASSLENSYYPRHDRTFADTMNRFGGALSSDAITDLLREFTPDMKRLFRRHAPKKIRRIEEKLPIPPEDKP